MAVSKLVVFSNQSISNICESCAVFDSWLSFLNANIDPIGFFILADLKKDYHNIVQSIRKSSFFYQFIFTEEDFGDKRVDGVATINEAIEKCKLMQEKKVKLKFSLDSLSQSEKLLVYFFLRDNLELFPEFNPQSPKLYTYPVIKCLSKDENNTEWLSELIRKNLLAFKTLVDRVRLCNKCGSAHLYFIDVCPNCKSIDIKKSRAVHCFSCGYVANESEFQTPQGLICPKCSSRLRHIGVDYDFTTTQFACNSCGFLFEEPLVLYRCMECGEQDLPEKLNTQEFYSIEMTLFGMEWLLKEQKEMLFSIFKVGFKNVDLDYFKFLVDWFISIYKREKCFAFGLLIMKFNNIDEIVKFYGMSNAIEIFEEFSRRINEMLRETDIVCKDDDFKIWIFLPATSKKGIENRLKTIIDNMQPQNGPGIKINIQIIYSSSIETTDTAESLMSKLEFTND